MALKKCIECGDTVSDKAHTCPHCECDPRGRACAVCNRTMKISEAIKVFHTRRPMVEGLDGQYYEASDGSVRDDRFIHKACLLALLPDVDMPCSDCGTPLNVRAHGLAKAPSLSILEGSPQCAHFSSPWSSSDDSRWSSYPDKTGGPYSCPKCGNPAPLKKKSPTQFQRNCDKCGLPVLRVHDAQVLSSTSTHKPCARAAAAGCLVSLLVGLSVVLAVSIMFVTFVTTVK